MTPPRSLSRFSYVAGTAATFAWVVLGAACSDALRIEPPPTTTTTVASSSTGIVVGAGGGGDGGSMPIQACVSNSDCEEPQNVCDQVKGICVECLEDEQCAISKPGTVCSKGACECAKDGTTELTYCGPNQCVDTATSADHCGGCDIQCLTSCTSSACGDGWESVATEGAPSARFAHVAVWTGDRMVVWGGTSSGNNVVATGGLYDPATREWSPMSLVGAPSARRDATAIWTGTEMIVWGGFDGTVYLNDGARYDPATDTWASMTTINSPLGRRFHTAVWTGTEMVVYGGLDTTNQLSSGAKYNPTNDQWVAAIPSTCTRQDHIAVWDAANTKMMVYGGFGDSLTLNNITHPDLTGTCAGGVQYDPMANLWSPLSAAGQPNARGQLAGAFHDGKFILFGGGNPSTAPSTYANTGYSYASNMWTLFGGAAPPGRYRHSGVMVGDDFVIYGGRNASGTIAGGGAYDTVNNSWRAVPGSLTAREFHTAVSTGSSMIVWGGTTNGSSGIATGGVYTP